MSMTSDMIEHIMRAMREIRMELNAVRTEVAALKRRVAPDPHIHYIARAAYNSKPDDPPSAA